MSELIGELDQINHHPPLIYRPASIREGGYWGYPQPKIGMGDTMHTGGSSLFFSLH